LAVLAGSENLYNFTFKNAILFPDKALFFIRIRTKLIKAADKLQ